MMFLYYNIHDYCQVYGNNLVLDNAIAGWDTIIYSTASGSDVTPVILFIFL